MKKVTLLFAAMLILQTRISAQVSEGYIPGNLGRIVEVAYSGGTISVPHLLIGYDTTGMVYQANSQNQYKVFGNYPNATSLQNLNNQNRFGAPGTNDCYEIRFGNDSSRYWINATAVGTGGTLAPNRLPFSVFHVGPRSSADTAITGGTKLCIKVADENSDGLYTPGERILVFADLALPFDSTYDSLSHRADNPFFSSRTVMTSIRFGNASVPYTQTTFNVATDGFAPANGTVIRFVATTADTIAPIVYALSVDTFRTNGVGTFNKSFSVYSYEEPVFTLHNAPPGMSVSNGNITWNVAEDLFGNIYNVTLEAANGAGTALRSFVAQSAFGLQDYLTGGAGNLLRLWQRSDGSIAYRKESSYFGLEYPANSGYSLNYAGGFYFGGKKAGTGGNPDTVNVAQCEYESEFQPGRIINSGPFGSLIGEDYTQNRMFFTLPGNEADWPAEAPRNSLGEPLKLSVMDSWTVFNDLPIHKVNDTFSRSPGFGMEIQRQTFQFNRYPFDHAVLVRMLFRNKSDKTYDSCYIGFWNDADVYNGYDDLALLDSALSLNIFYSNPAGTDEPTAFGCAILQGPLVSGQAGDSAVKITIDESGFHRQIHQGHKIIPATSGYIPVKNSQEPHHNQGDLTRFHYLKGLDYLGNLKPGGPFDPGDLTGTPLDKRGVISTGPFSFVPNDSQEVWYVMIGGTGINIASSVDTIRHYAAMIRDGFGNYMNEYLVGVPDNRLMPKSAILHANYPNPFNPSTTIRYELKQSSRVSLKIYNLLGQEVRTLVNTQKSSGIHTAVWDGKNNQGQRVSSGVYLYRLEAGDFVKTRKMVLVK